MRVALTNGVPHMPIVAIYLALIGFTVAVPEARHRRLQEARPQLTPHRTRLRDRASEFTSTRIGRGHAGSGAWVSSTGSGRWRGLRGRRRARRGAGSIHSPSWSRTRRTHHASASERLRATPAPTSVSSTWRSDMRRRVITGTASDGEHAPLVAAAARPTRPCGRCAARPRRRCSCAARGCPRGSAGCGPRGRWRGRCRRRPSGSRARRARPTTRISSRSVVTSARLGEPVVGEPPGEPAGQILGLGAVVISSLHHYLHSRASSRAEPRGRCRSSGARTRPSRPRRRTSGGARRSRGGRRLGAGHDVHVQVRHGLADDVVLRDPRALGAEPVDHRGATPRHRAEQRRRNSAGSSGSVTTCTRGITSTCPLNTGPMSRNATTSGSSSTTCDRSLPATTAQNTQPSPGMTCELRGRGLVGGIAVEERDRDVGGRRGHEHADAAGDRARARRR